MPTQIKKKQLKTDEFIQPQATADWNRDDITASAYAIAAKIASSGVRKITTNYKIWDLEEGVYYVDGTKRADYSGGSFTIYQNYYLFVANYNHVTPDKKRFIAFWELDNNGDDIEFLYGTCSSSRGTLASKKLSQIKNMSGATTNADGNAGFAPAPAAGDNTKYLRGDATWQAIPGMVGATSSVAGSAGLVPAPSAGDESKSLRGDGTWKDNFKIYNWDTTAEHWAESSIVDIVNDYNDGFVCYLNMDNYRLPLYEAFISSDISGVGPDVYIVKFGFTNFKTSSIITQLYFKGRSVEGVESWEIYANGDGPFPGGRNFGGATSALQGQNGLVPAPAAGDEGKVLFGDGTWKNVGITLDGVAVGYTTAGYKYQFEYGGVPISYNEIVAKISNGIPVVASTNGPLWYLSSQNDCLFKRVGVYNNQLQLRRLRHVVEDNEDFWDEEIEYTTT